MSTRSAHIASTTAAYEVGTSPLNERPVSFLSSSESICIPLTSRPDSTNGTMAIRIGLSGLPSARLFPSEEQPTSRSMMSALPSARKRGLTRVDHHMEDMIAGNDADEQTNSE